MSRGDRREAIFYDDADRVAGALARGRPGEPAEGTPCESKDCPATAPANADESSVDCRSAKIGSASYVSNLLPSVDSQL
jgi:hypothetical protein